MSILVGNAGARQSSIMKPPIVIIGGGLGGSLLSIVLAQKNYTVDLYEERSDIRTIPPLSNRSINQSLSIRGINILEKIGVRTEGNMSSTIPPKECPPVQHIEDIRAKS